MAIGPLPVWHLFLPKQLPSSHMLVLSMNNWNKIFTVLEHLVLNYSYARWAFLYLSRWPLTTLKKVLCHCGHILIQSPGGKSFLWPDRWCRRGCTSRGSRRPGGRPAPPAPAEAEAEAPSSPTITKPADNLRFQTAGGQTRKIVTKQKFTSGSDD